MNVTLEIRVDETNFLRFERTLTKLVSAEALERLSKAAADRVAEKMRDHFLEKDTKGNKRGWSRSNFWGEIARATTRGTSGDAVADVIVGDRRLAIHVYGGVVRPKERRALTVPLHPMAKGKRVSVLQGELGVKIFPLKPKRGRRDTRGILAAKIGGKVVALYALRSKVTIPRDPEALPSPEQLKPALQETFEDWYEIETEGGSL